MNRVNIHIINCDGYSQSGELAVNFSNPRIQALQKFFAETPMQLALSVEAGAELVR